MSETTEIRDNLRKSFEGKTYNGSLIYDASYYNDVEKVVLIDENREHIIDFDYHEREAVLKECIRPFPPRFCVRDEEFKLFTKKQKAIYSFVHEFIEDKTKNPEYVTFEELEREFHRLANQQ